MIIFGETTPGGLESLIILAGVIFSIFVFLKFCSWAKGFQISAQVKKALFILTAVGLIAFNVAYSIGNKSIAHGDWSMATIALASALIWVFIFAFALMAETKSE